VLLNKETD